jgi:hypothetical protein
MQRPDGSGAWINGLSKVRRIPYRLPEAVAAAKRGKSLFVVEGEQKVEDLRELGLEATCNPGGAGKWLDAYTDLFDGVSSVGILADNDEPGRRHADQVAASFHRHGVRDIRVHWFADLEEKGDVSDWLAAQMLDLAARVSKGQPMPDGSASDGPGLAIILSAEDDPASIIRPRLETLGAILERVFFVEIPSEDGTCRPPLIRPADIRQIEKVVGEVTTQTESVKLIVVDPLVAFLPHDVNANHDQEVRRALVELKSLAERTGAAVVAVRHLRKAGTDNALYRGSGSIGIIGAARAGLLIAKDPDDPEGNRRVLAATKMNLAPLSGSHAFRLLGDNETSHPCVFWEGRITHTAEELLAPPRSDDELSALEEAHNFLQDTLAKGPRPAVEVMREARDIGVSIATLRRAKKILGVKARKRGKPGERRQLWEWELAPHVIADIAQRVTQKHEPLREEMSIFDEGLAAHPLDLGVAHEA